jgi:pyridinium-3,5-biscarboxylic acid mononucleotide sulfurtransferase
MMHRLLDIVRTTAATTARGELALAFSGGLDSRFLAHAMQLAGVPCQLFHCSGAHVAQAESRYAQHWATKQGLPLTLLPCNPLLLPAVAAGSKERCYACKHALFSQILAQLQGQTLCDGSNMSDAAQFRPGRRALHELGIVSPLALAGITKAQVRMLAQQTGLENPMQQARPCLLTRLPYGMPPSPALLRRLELCETIVLAVFEQHYSAQNQPDFRVRCLATGGLVIHCTHMPDKNVCLSLYTALAKHGLAAPVEVIEKLSGFFDRMPELHETKPSPTDDFS